VQHSADVPEMERRKYIRFTSDQQAVIVLLEQERCCLAGKIKDFSERGLRVEVPEKLRIGALVKIEVSDALLFGEVMHIQSQEAQFLAGFRIEEVLPKAMLRILHRNAEQPQPEGEKDLENCEPFPELALVD
jgi:hypothetical protein